MFFQRLLPRLPRIVLGLYGLAWLACVADWLSTGLLAEGGAWVLRLMVFLASVPAGIYWLAWGSGQARSLTGCPFAPTRHVELLRVGVYSALYVLWWPLAVFLADALGWYAIRAGLGQLGVAGLFLIGLAWMVWFVERTSQHYLDLRRAAGIEIGEPDPNSIPSRAPAIVVTLLVGLVWFLCLGQWLWWDWFDLGFLDAQGGWRAGLRTAVLALPPLAIAAVWLRWAWRHPGIRNPLDQDAWYYGRRGKKLTQSLTALFSYSLAFLLLAMLVNQLSGCQEIYELPAGGGKPTQIVQTLQVQKVIKKKFVINPFSAIIFNPPPIDEVKLQLNEITQHQYAVGYGTGTGAGFAGGTQRGKVRFIRLEYGGGDWNQDFGVGADLNMLVEYGVRTSQQVAGQTESRTVSQLNNFPVGKSPPLVYLTGERSISLSKGEIKVLRDFLVDKHGMLFGDNGGSWHFHTQFFSMMQQVLPNAEPVRVPLDDVIHRTPYALPFLPYVAPHGGKDAWGWKVDGRWVCYYHPGDIADAWTDDHSGTDPEIYEACYQLGTNIIFYAHLEYAKWLEARQQK